MRFAIIGTGFWARYQLGAWRELKDAQCVALCDLRREKAEALARDYAIPAVYDDMAAMLDRERPDFVDVITDVYGHVPCVQMALSRRVPAICQKPLAPSLAESEGLLQASRDAGVPLLVHENWRWQVPIRQLKRALDEGSIGTPFRARISVVSGFPVVINQPGLKEQERFVMADMGSHLFDLARFLFGEATSIYAHADRIHADIKGDDVATIIMKMGGKTTVTCEMGYAENFLEHDRFPETYVFIEGERGSIELAPDFWLRVTTKDGTHATRHTPPTYAWANPDYAVVHSSMVPCNTNLLRGLRGEGPVETTAEDNLKTLRLVYAAYESAEKDQVIRL